MTYSSGKVIVFFFTLISMVSAAITFGPPLPLSSTDYTSEGTPLAVDWNRDGLVDILFGERVPGSNPNLADARVGFWKNIGTAANPSFADQGDLKAGGKDIAIGVG